MDTVVSTETADILLVEDQPHDAELALRALKKLDLDERIALVRDGAAALDFLFGRGEYAGRALADAPRLILLDLKLPKVSGIEVLRTLKSDERTRHIPVIVLTSSGEACDVEACYDLGVNSYVVKPVDFAQFTETVQQIGTYWLGTNEPPC
ncbi:MAG: response regulator [Bacteroidetes bacterium]|jgi:CheY-like chemotaxis protein|nr:response regulator [Bacteroidota bacterium]